MRKTIILTCFSLFLIRISYSCFAATVAIKAAGVNKGQSQSDQPKKLMRRQDDRQWSFMVYHGTTSKQPLGRLKDFRYTSAGEELYSAELAYALQHDNPLVRFINIFYINRLQAAFNLAQRHDYYSPQERWDPEVALYFMLRITHFPWDNYLRTSLAIGEGVSYAYKRIYVENGITGNISPKFLNFLVFEIGFSLPQYPYLELIGRIHHRSGCYGLYYPREDHPGSNNVGLGIRYYFH